MTPASRMDAAVPSSTARSRSTRRSGPAGVVHPWRSASRPRAVGPDPVQVFIFDVDVARFEANGQATERRHHSPARSREHDERRGGRCATRVFIGLGASRAGVLRDAVSLTRAGPLLRSAAVESLRKIAACVEMSEADERWRRFARHHLWYLDEIVSLADSIGIA